MTGTVMLDIEGKTLSPEDLEILSHPQTGGLILFARNVDTPDQVTELTRAIRQVRPDILIAVDQEGGRVQRLKNGFTRLPAMRHLGRLYDQNAEAALELAQDLGWLLATELRLTGIDFSFAPVLDIDGISQVIGDRAFHSQPDIIPELAGAFIDGLHLGGTAATGKHFPGHGSVEADSHIAAPVDPRSLAEIRAHDLQAFIPLLKKLEAIMPAHVIYPAVDPLPAGFSSFWLQKVLRQELGFSGVIFSDDLSMHAAGAAGTVAGRIHAAIAAGCDMGLVCNDRKGAWEALKAMEGQPKPDPARLTALYGRTPAVSGQSNAGVLPVQASRADTIRQKIGELLAGTPT